MINRTWHYPEYSSGIFSIGSVHADELKLDSEADRISYSLGQQIGRDFKRQRVELDEDSLVRGFGDANLGAEPVIGRRR